MRSRPASGGSALARAETAQRGGVGSQFGSRAERPRAHAIKTDHGLRRLLLTGGSLVRQRRDVDKQEHHGHADRHDALPDAKSMWSREDVARIETGVVRRAIRRGAYPVAGGFRLRDGTRRCVRLATTATSSLGTTGFGTYI
jgi:hypothetical protein